MERLPLEIVLDIITRLPIASLLRFKCVCKAWLSIAEDLHLLRLYHQNTAQNNVCLVLQGEHSLDCQLHVIDPSNHHHKTITKRLDPPFKSSMPNFDIAGSCNGFLCLFDDSQLVPDTIFIYNPFTNESKQLPPTNKNFSNQRVVLGFGFDPISREYKVIRIVYCIPPMVSWYIRYETSEISINTLGTDSWRSLGQAAYWLDGGTPSTYVNGSLHWLAQCHKFQQYQDIVRFDLATEQFKKVPGPSSKEFWRHCYSIVELRGCLCAVVHTNNSDTIEVWIMKDYNVKESWAKEFVIPAHVPFGLNDINLSHRMLKKWFARGSTRVLCRLQTGEFLLEYGNQALVPYDPHQEEFKKLDIHGLPNCFETVTFKGSLLPLQDHTQMQI